MKPGAYELCMCQNLREGPGLQYARKPASNHLTTDRFGRLVPGSILEIYEIRNLSVSTWGRCKEGWVCLETGQTIYGKEMFPVTSLPSDS